MPGSSGGALLRRILALALLLHTACVQEPEPDTLEIFCAYVVNRDALPQDTRARVSRGYLVEYTVSPLDSWLIEIGFTTGETIIVRGY